jgi:serine/threonine protein kinase
MTLSKYIDKMKYTIREEVLIFLCVHLLLGLNKKHNSNLLHLDIKPDNILIINGKIKYSDFGLAQRYYCERPIIMMGGQGTKGYLAPECSTQVGIYSKSADFYALGKTIMRFLQPSGYYDFLLAGKSISMEFYDFVTSLTSSKRETRLGTKCGVEEVFSHVIFKNIDIEKIKEYKFICK